MGHWRQNTDAIHWYMQEVSSRVVAESGIPSDTYHLGKLILQGFKKDPDFTLTIDGATGETETFESALKRSVQCATAFRKLGVKHGDVVLLMSPNHIHLSVPMYAALYIGAGVAGIDMNLKVNELRGTFTCNGPKIIFCQKEKENDVESALEGLNLDSRIITFDKGDKHLTFSDLLAKYGCDVSVEDFKASDFDTDQTIALLIATSGTTGLPKSVAVSHKNLAVSIPYMWRMYDKFPTPTRLPIVFSPIQWYSALFQFVFSPIIRHTRLQSSQPMTQEHAYYLIKKYRPTFAMASPNMLTNFFKTDHRDKCDFTSFEVLQLAGSAVPPKLIKDIKLLAREQRVTRDWFVREVLVPTRLLLIKIVNVANGIANTGTQHALNALLYPTTFVQIYSYLQANTASPNTNLLVIYGMSELSGIAFNFDPALPQSLGKPLENFKHKLVNPETLEDVVEINKNGELWLKGPGIFKGYYNNPKETSQVFAEGGWFRSGDVMSKDEKGNFYFVDRLKLLLIYNNYLISPLEIEGVISQHPGVFDVAVTGIPHPEHGDLESLSETKQLRGGVVFMKELPLTSTSKIDRQKLSALAQSINRE